MEMCLVYAVMFALSTAILSLFICLVYIEEDNLSVYYRKFAKWRKWLTSDWEK